MGVVSLEAVKARRGSAPNSIAVAINSRRSSKGSSAANSTALRAKASDAVATGHLPCSTAVRRRLAVRYLPGPNSALLVANSRLQSVRTTVASSGLHLRTNCQSVSGKPLARFGFGLCLLFKLLSSVKISKSVKCDRAVTLAQICQARLESRSSNSSLFDCCGRRTRCFFASAFSACRMARREHRHRSGPLLKRRLPKAFDQRAQGGVLLPHSAARVRSSGKGS